MQKAILYQTRFSSLAVYSELLYLWQNSVKIESGGNENMENSSQHIADSYQLWLVAYC